MEMRRRRMRRSGGIRETDMITTRWKESARSFTHIETHSLTHYHSATTRQLSLPHTHTPTIHSLLAQPSRLPAHTLKNICQRPPPLLHDLAPSRSVGLGTLHNQDRHRNQTLAANLPTFAPSFLVSIHGPLLRTTSAGVSMLRGRQLCLR